jgi:hypothetical protein
MDTIATLPTDGTRAQFAPFLPEMPDNGHPIARLHFDSLAEMAAMIPRQPPPSAPHQDCWHEKSGFYGVSTKEAHRLAAEGWQEGATRAALLMDKIKTARPTRKALTRWDVAGALPSVPRYLAGNPLNMRQAQRSASSQQPVITIATEIGGPASVETRTFEARAVAAAAIVDRLEDAGFRVEILGGMRSSNDNTGVREATGANNARGKRAEVFFKVKAAQDTLDLARVAFGLGHPSATRRLCFQAMSSHPDFHPVISFGMGYTVPLAPLDRPPGTYTLPPLMKLDKIRTAEKIFDAVLDHLKAQGCPGLE